MSAADDCDCLFKILLIGDAGVGKTSLLLRYIDDTFTDSLIEMTCEYKSKTIDYEGAKILLQIWDTAGQERFRTITSSYYRGAHGIILVYDITNEKSFKSMKPWLNEAQRYAYESVSKILVGNKSDLPEDQKIVTLDMVKEFAEPNSLPFIETSAKTSFNVEQVFQLLLTDIVKREAEKLGIVTKKDQKGINRASYMKKEKCSLS